MVAAAKAAIANRPAIPANTTSATSMINTTKITKRKKETSNCSIFSTKKQK